MYKPDKIGQPLLQLYNKYMIMVILQLSKCKQQNILQQILHVIKIQLKAVLNKNIPKCSKCTVSMFSLIRNVYSYL